jgi:hypothetical protein
MPERGLSWDEALARWRAEFHGDRQVSQKHRAMLLQLKLFQSPR